MAEDKGKGAEKGPALTPEEMAHYRRSSRFAQLAEIALTDAATGDEDRKKNPAPLYVVVGSGRPQDLEGIAVGIKRGLLGVEPSVNPTDVLIGEYKGHRAFLCLGFRDLSSMEDFNMAFYMLRESVDLVPPESELYSSLFDHQTDAGGALTGYKKAALSDLRKKYRVEG